MDCAGRSLSHDSLPSIIVERRKSKRGSSSMAAPSGTPSLSGDLYGRASAPAVPPSLPVVQTRRRSSKRSRMDVPSPFPPISTPLPSPLPFPSASTRPSPSLPSFPSAGPSLCCASSGARTLPDLNRSPELEPLICNSNGVDATASSLHALQPRCPPGVAGHTASYTPDACPGLCHGAIVEGASHSTTPLHGRHPGGGGCSEVEATAGLPGAVDERQLSPSDLLRMLEAEALLARRMEAQLMETQALLQIKSSQLLISLRLTRNLRRELRRLHNLRTEEASARDPQSSRDTPAASNNKRYSNIVCEGHEECVGDSGNSSAAFSDSKCSGFDHRRGLCEACGLATATTVALPCRHLAFCEQCSGSSDCCPRCSRKVGAVLHIKE